MTVSTRVREESGFGLVELLIAMTVMVVGITALVAGMSSGMVAVKRAGDESTAAALADKQMEAYRALPTAAIYLEASTITSAGGPYGLRRRRQCVFGIRIDRAQRARTGPIGLHACATALDDRCAPVAHRRRWALVTWVERYIVTSHPVSGIARQEVTRRRPRLEGHNRERSSPETNSRPRPAATTPSTRPGSTGYYSR